MLLGVEPPCTLCIPARILAVQTGNQPMRSDSACRQCRGAQLTWRVPTMTTPYAPTVLFRLGRWKQGCHWVTILERSSPVLPPSSSLCHLP
jgi:hypothetical protein